MVLDRHVHRWMLGIALLASGAAGCRDPEPVDRVRLAGHVEATEVRIAPEVGGRVVELRVAEGRRVQAGDVVARLDTADTELTRQRAQAERRQAEAQLRLLQAGARAEDIRQAEAQASGAEADLAATQAELASARTDLARFEELLTRNSGSRKQRDDAATRVDVASGRVRSAEERVRAALETVRRLRAGARPEELDAARARVAAVDATLATLEKALRDAVVQAPAGGVITETLVEQGELIAPRAPIAILTDLDHAWANVYIGEPMVPRLRLGQTATIYTDAGGAGLAGTVSHISERAEFTPRNVQTAEERSKLVFRVKVTVDNASGVLKPGMPVEADVPLSPIEPRSPAGGALEADDPNVSRVTEGRAP